MSGNNRNRFRWLYYVGTVIALFLCSVFVVFFLPNSFDPSPKFITVSKGQSFSSLADSLEQKGIIFSQFTFKIAGRYLGITQKMRVGKYSFVSGVTNMELLHDIESGRSTVSTTVPMREGVKTKVFARILKRHIGIDSARFMQFYHDTSLIGIYPHNSTSLEGYLMPDTYSFFWQDD